MPGIGSAAMGAIGEMSVLIVPDASGFGAKTEAALATQTAGLNAGASKSGSALGQKFGLALAGGAAAALGKGVLDFTQFERGMNEIFTLIPGQSQKMYDELSDQTKQFSAEFGVSTQQTIKGIYDAMGAGVPQDNVFDFLETANQFAKAGATDLTVAVDALTTGVNAFGLGAEGAGRVSDNLFKSVQLGKATVDEMAASLFQVAPTAAAFGVQIEDISAAYAVLTAAGTPARVAATQVKSAIAELGKEGTKASKAFEEIAGKSFTQFIAEGGNLIEAAGLMGQAADESGKSIIDMFGSIEAGQAFLGLTADMETSISFLEQMQESAGSTEVAFDQMQKGIGPALDKIKARLEVAFINLGETIAPSVEAIGLALAGLVGFIAELPGPLATATVAGIGFAGMLLALAGPIGKTITLIGQISKAMKALSLALAANPWVLVVAAIAGAAYLIYKNWDTIKEAFAEGWAAVSDTLSDMWDGITGFFTDVFDFVEKWVNRIREAFNILFKGDFTGISDWAEDAPIVDQLFDIRDKVIGVIDDIKGAFRKGLDGLEKYIVNPLKRIAEGFDTYLVQPIQTVIDVLFTNVMQATETWIGRWTTVFETVWTVLQIGWEGAMSGVQSVISTGLSVVGAIVNAFQVAWSATWGAITLATQTAVAAIMVVLNPIVDFLSVVLTAAINGFQVVWGVAWSGITVALQTAWSVLGGILGFIKDRLGEVQTALGALMGIGLTVFGVLRSVIGSAIDFIIGKLDQLKRKLGDLLGPLGDVAGKIGGLGGQIGGGVGGLAKSIIGFDTGGVVPGPVGQPVLALVHGGETIYPTHKDPQAGPQSGGTVVNRTVNLNINGPITVDSKERIYELRRELYEAEQAEAFARGEAVIA